jgi:hypothetical protein
VALLNLPAYNTSIQMVNHGAPYLGLWRSPIRFAMAPEMEPSNFVAVSAEGDVAFYDVSINATRVWVGNCPSVCQRKSFIAPGELLRLGNGFAVTLDTNCSGAAGVGVCVSKHTSSDFTHLAELPAETVPSSVGVNGDTVAFAIKNASTFEGFTIFVRSAAGGGCKRCCTRGRAGRSASWY